MAQKGDLMTARPDIRVLDATIRDGGLVNNFMFTDDFINALYRANVKAGIDYMEFGYKASKELFDVNKFGKWKFCDEAAIREIVGDNNSDMKISVMADVGRCDYKKDILPREDSVIDMVRVATYVHQMPAAIEMIEDAHAKGYETTCNIMAVSKDQESDIDLALELLGKSNVDGIYIVDSYGALYPEESRRLADLYCSIADKYGKPVLFDSARFAENAYFIKMREEGYRNKSIKEITREMFDLADGMTMSAKKDGIVNMGGFIATRRKDWYEGAKGFCVQFEGYLTYGGMNGRDMNALAIGLDENTEFDNLETRIHQVGYLAMKLDEYGIPYQRPAGGHAIFVDAPKVLTHVPKEEFPAQTLTIELYLEAGIRGCEIGYILADRDPVTHENRFNGLDLLRLAIPRRVYTDNHMNVIAAALKNVYERRESITHGVRIAWEAPLMRHFTVQLERL